MQKNEVNDGKIIFSKGCDEWLNFKRNLVKESSYLNYKFKINKHLIPDFGNKTLSELSKSNLNEYIINKKLKEGVKENSIKDSVMFLKAILRYLKKKYKVDFDLDFNYRIDGNLDEIEVFTEKEKQTLTKYLLESNKARTVGILISLYAGLRIGEVCGLKWEDIDFENRIINVRRTVQRVYIKGEKSRVIVTTPKSKKSIRQIPLAKILINKLKPMSQRYSKNDFVLTRKA